MCVLSPLFCPGESGEMIHTPDVGVCDEHLLYASLPTCLIPYVFEMLVTLAYLWPGPEEVRFEWCNKFLPLV